jgi:methylated-DNA-[protein]-cysteine S-methyltransferase
MRRKSPENVKEWVYAIPDTPLGPVWLFFTQRGLAALEFVGEGHVSLLRDESLPDSLLPEIEHVKQRLAAYFSGEVPDFGVLALDLDGTAFQRRVWQELRKIPYGSTISYKELARRVGSSPRAVGQANAVNPVPIIVPCHRVVNADGGLGGYSSGLDRKRWLLRREGAQ